MTSGPDEWPEGSRPVLAIGRRRISMRDRELSIGRRDEGAGIRPDVDLRTEDPGRSVSRRHAQLQFDGLHLWLIDLASGNGTTLDGTAIHAGEKNLVQPGAQILVGDVAVYVLAEAADAARAAGAALGVQRGETAGAAEHTAGAPPGDPAPGAARAATAPTVRRAPDAGVVIETDAPAPEVGSHAATESVTGGHDPVTAVAPVAAPEPPGASAVPGNRAAEDAADRPDGPRPAIVADAGPDTPTAAPAQIGAPCDRAATDDRNGEVGGPRDSWPNVPHSWDSAKVDLERRPNADPRETSYVADHWGESEPQELPTVQKPSILRRLLRRRHRRA